MTIPESALGCLGADLSVLPAHLAEKRPAVPGWKTFQTSLPTEQQVRTWFTKAEALCIVTGAVSGRLEMIDFDGQGVLFDAWRERVRAEDP